MSRQARIDLPGLLQHVIVRGVARSDIFLDDEDREEFVRRLSALLVETSTRCYAWALLDNHVHLLLLPTEHPLARLMRRLLTGYAVYFNLRHNRSGHLFQNRYKSIVCDADNYLLELIRYIHLNPVRSGLVNNLGELTSYCWCGHRQLLRVESRGMICADDVLSLFAQRKRAAVARYVDFLADGLAQESRHNLSGGGKRVSQYFNQALAVDDVFDDRILGGGAFVEKVLTAAESLPVPDKSLEELIDCVAHHCGVAVEELAHPCRQADMSRAKALICYWATRRCRIPGNRVAERLGLSTSAVSLASKRGQYLLENDEGLRKVLV